MTKVSRIEKIFWIQDNDQLYIFPFFLIVQEIRSINFNKCIKYLEKEVQLCALMSLLTLWLVKIELFAI